MKEFEVGQKIVSALGNPMVVTKVTPKHIKCDYLNKLVLGKTMWTMYRKNGKPYKRLMKDNGMS